MTTDAADVAALRTSASEIGDKLVEVEQKVYQLLLKGTGQDRVRWPTKVYGRFTYPAGGVATADSRRPTSTARCMPRQPQELEEALDELEAILQADLPDLNRRFREANLPNVIAALPQPRSDVAEKGIHPGAVASCRRPSATATSPIPRPGADQRSWKSGVS